eukprot:TRINITY_DN3808_c0_g6_i1.p1 TRINITY_DN3808_c0_g6~~TRINITY_DN3808_c0_g6_i1.p1  ORF type:complete len:102 (-),score=42.80 TRINITY_DN3808_c0_g6_i1:60-365(-)
MMEAAPDECSGHEAEGYKEYVLQMVGDFKRSYGGYVTAFAYPSKSGAVECKLAKPVCKFEGECRKPISVTQLLAIVKELDGEKGIKELTQQLANFDKLTKP